MASANENATLRRNYLDSLSRAEPDACKIWVRLYGPLIYGWARSAGKSPPESARFVRTVARHLLGNGAGDPGEGPYHLWLRDQVGSLLASGDNPVSPEFEKEQRWGGVVLRALKQVEAQANSEDWSAFKRVVLDKESVEAVAQDLGRSKSIIYGAKAKVLHLLRRELAGEL